MIRRRLSLILLIFLVLPLVNAVDLNTGTVFNTTSSNSSMTFTRNTTAEEIRITSTKLFLQNYVDPNGKTCDITHTAENTNIDSATFNCTPTTGGGGTGKIPFLNEINTTLCNETYKYIQRYGDDDFTKIFSFLEDVQNRTNITFEWTQTREYITNWQRWCSDLLNLSLQEDFVCSEVEVFLIDHSPNDLVGIDGLRDGIEEELKISYELTKYYVDNFNEQCRKPIFLTVKPRDIAFVLFICSLIIFLAIFYRKEIKSTLRKVY